MRRAGSAFLALWRSLWHDERGISLVFTAITITVLLAITGLAVDVGWWYTVHRQNQSAADAAALSAAYEIYNRPTWTQTDLISYATTAAAQNGYSGSTPTGSCSANASRLCYPYSDSTVSGAVEVQLQQPQNTWFASLAGLSSVTISNRAVAGTVILDSSCAYVLNATAPKSLTIQGSGSLYAPTCSICVDSNASNAVYMNGSTNTVLQADALLINGELATSGQPVIQLNHLWETGYSGCTDPYTGLTHTFLTTGMPTTACGAYTTTTDAAGLTWYNFPGNCQVSGSLLSGLFKTGNVLLSANTEITNPQFSSTNTTTLSVSGSTNTGILNLSPGGSYWIADGDFSLGAGATLECTSCTFPSSTSAGSGLSIILTTAQSSGGYVGNISSQSNAVIDSLNAPYSGNYANLLLIQDSNGLPTGTTFTTPCKSQGTPYSCSTFQGGPSQTFFGLVYFPDSALNFQGNPTTGNYGCLITVANTLSIAGNATNGTPNLSTAGCPTGVPGGVKQIKIVSLFE